MAAVLMILGIALAIGLVIRFSGSTEANPKRTTQVRRPLQGGTELLKRVGGEITHVAEIEGTAECEFEIVGESHYQEELNHICGGKCPGGYRMRVTAYLTTENKNPHDPQAVMVTIQGFLVGYLSREHARELRAQFPDHDVLAWKVDALIVGGWEEENGDTGHYGVKLALPVAEE